jgi:gliding motility-associated-like protein
MKVKRALLLCVFTLSFAFSFAQITADKTSVCAPSTVTFTSPVGATTHNWDFGDGTFANNASPQHIYTTAGNYTVTYSGNGGAFTGSVAITVHPKPVAKFVATPTHGCIPLSVQFTDQSTSGVAITGWQWTYGDGGSNNVQQNPNYNFTLVGSFNVVLIATDANGCTDDTTWTTPIVTTNKPPIANFIPSVLQSCTAPLTVSFVNTSSAGNGGALSYTWDFGNGGPTSNLQTPPNVTYNSTGIYNVTLTVDEANGCTSVKTIPIVVSKPLSSFSLVNDTICQYGQYAFSNLSLGATSYLWDFGNGKTSNQINPTTGYSTGGTYNVKLTASANGCSDDTTVAIFVEDIVPNFSNVPSYWCDFPKSTQFNDLSSTTIVGWNWSFGDPSSGANNTSTSQNPTHVYNKPDDSPFTVYDPIFNSVRLIVTNNHGCKDTITKTDTIVPIVGRLQPDVAEGCVPLTVNFSDSSRSRETINNYIWNFGDPLSGVNNTSGLKNPTHVYNTPGEYAVTVDVTNVKGCRDTSYAIVIRVGEKTNPNFSALPISVCPQDTVTLTDLTLNDSTDSWHYTSDGGILSSCPGDASTKWVFNSAAGFHNVTLTTGFNGCFDDTTIVNAVEVKGPIARLNFTAQCDTANKFTFKGEISGADSWTWIFGEGGVGDTIYNYTDSTVVHYYAASGDYKARIIGKNLTSGCADFQDSVVVKVRNIKSEFVHDYVICEKVSHTFDASASQDVFNVCNNGYRWDWGDGSPPDLSGITTQTHTYADTGVYTIRLITTAVTGCKDTSYFDQRVYGIDVKFAADKLTGCLPLLVNFTDQSVSDTTINKWTWVYGDGTPNGTTQNPSHTYFGNSANYTVKLIAQDELGCKDSITKTITPIYPNPNFSGPTQVCTGTPHNTKFIGSGNNIVKYTWDFNDGTPIQTGNNLSHAFSPAPGPYSVKLVVTDNNGCMDSITKNNYVSVQDYPVASFTSDADNVTPLCYPKQISFTNNSTGNVASIAWDLDNGSPTLPTSPVSTTYNTPGIYNAKLTVTSSYGCVDDTIRPFNVVGPVADFDMDKSLICVGEEVTFTIKNMADVDSWEWDFGGTVVQGGSPRKHKFDYYPPGGTNNITLNVYSLGKACSFPVKHPLNLHDAYAKFGMSDSVVCANETITVTDSSGGADSWTWVVNPGGQTFSGQTPGAIGFSSAGNYTISLRVLDNTSGCKDTLDKAVVVDAIPTFSISNTGPICQGNNVTLSASNKVGYTYSWTPSANVNSPTSASTTANPSTTTLYSVDVTNSKGCTDTKTTNVIVYTPIPSIPFDTNKCIVAGQSINLGTNLGNNYTYDWTAGNTKNLSCTKCAITTVKVTANATYVFTVTDVLGCFSSTNPYQIEVCPDHTVDVPSAFTPNEDGVNDIIYVDGWGIEKLNSFRIYNRWGELVFESNDLKIGWNGVYKHSPQPSDTYVYQVEGEFYGGESFTKSGTITLIR